MADLSERHEVRLRGRDNTIYFIADSDDGRLIIRQESEGKKQKEVCSITLSDPEELRGFFKGLRRIMTALGVTVDSPAEVAQQRRPALAAPARKPEASGRDDRDRDEKEREREEMVVAARARNEQAFAPWSKDEEQEVLRRYKAGETVAAIAKARKRSVRAIELRLQRLGALPPRD